MLSDYRPSNDLARRSSALAPFCLLLCFGDSCNWLKTRLFHRHTQNVQKSLSAAASPQTPLAELTAQHSSRSSSAAFKGEGKGEEGIGRGLE